MVATRAVPVEMSLALRDDSGDAHLNVTILMWASNVEDGVVESRGREIGHGHQTKWRSASA